MRHFLRFAIVFILAAEMIQTRKLYAYSRHPLIIQLEARVHVLKTQIDQLVDHRGQRIPGLYQLVESMSDLKNQVEELQSEESGRRAAIWDTQDPYHQAPRYDHIRLTLTKQLASRISHLEEFLRQPCSIIQLGNRIAQLDAQIMQLKQQNSAMAHQAQLNSLISNAEKENVNTNQDIVDPGEQAALMQLVDKAMRKHAPHQPPLVH